MMSLMQSETWEVSNCEQVQALRSTSCKVRACMLTSASVACRVARARASCSVSSLANAANAAMIAGHVDAGILPTSPKSIKPTRPSGRTSKLPASQCQKTVNNMQACGTHKLRQGVSGVAGQQRQGSSATHPDARLHGMMEPGGLSRTRHSRH